MIAPLTPRRDPGLSEVLLLYLTPRERGSCGYLNHTFLNAQSARSTRAVEGKLVDDMPARNARQPVHAAACSKREKGTA